MRILIVEDEIFSANYLKETLINMGYEVVASVDNATDALYLCQQLKPQIILMDIMLKGPISGAEAALKISTLNPDIAIIFLTAYSQKEMIDYAVASKAFAYLLKPYRIEEIAAALRLAKKHLDNIPAPNPFIELVDDFRFNIQDRKLYHAYEEIELTPNSRKLLEILCQTPDTFVSSQKIVSYIWGPVGSLEALRALIYRFKKKISPNLIESSIKKGYKITTRSF